MRDGSQLLASVEVLVYVLIFVTMNASSLLEVPSIIQTRKDPLYLELLVHEALSFCALHLCLYGIHQNLLRQLAQLRSFSIQSERAYSISH